MCFPFACALDRPKPKKVALKLNKKERRLALQTLLYNKKNNVIIIEDLENTLTESKTKSFLSMCENWNINSNQKVLLVVSEKIGISDKIG